MNPIDSIAYPEARVGEGTWDRFALTMIVRLLLWLIHLPLQGCLALLFGVCDLLRGIAGWRPFRPRSRSGGPLSQPFRCSVVMLNWNGRHLLQESLPPLLEAVAREGGEHEILVVDNGSDDDSLDWLRTHFPQVVRLELDRNYGFAEGNNRGVEAARHDIVVLLNNDMMVQEGFLAPLLAPFAQEDVFAVTSQIFFPPGKRREETGNTRGRLRWGKLELAHHPLEEAHRRRPALPVLWGGGGSTAFRRERFLGLGGFSEIFSPVYVEDADLSYRAWRRGWRVLVAERSRVVHKHRASSGKRFDEKELQALIEERKLWYLWKNYPLVGLLKHFLLYPLHLGRELSTSAYWRSLRRLPWALALRMKEPRAVYSDRQIRQWLESPRAYLDRFDPDRAQRSRGERLRILVVSAYLPHLGYHGGGGRVFQLMKQVARRHDVTLAAFVESDKEMQETVQAAAFCKRMEIVRRGGFTPVSYFPYEPFEEFNSPEMRRTLERLAAEEDFDAVHFEWTQMAYYSDLFPHLPKLVTEIEVNYAAHQTQVKVEPNPLRKLRLHYNTLQTLNRELQLCRRVDKVVCVTDDDADYLAGYLPPSSLEVVNTGVDTEYFAYSPAGRSQPGTIVFVGAFRHSPNIDAMRFYCGEVFPQVLEACPQARLLIVGSSPPNEIRRLGRHPQIEVTGFVEDLRDYYARAQVVTVPLRTGVGIRGKVLEGWSAGRAMVATTLACQGIRARHGENILIADSPRDIARWTIALLLHPEFARHLGRNGRRMVEERYDWRPLGRRMIGIYQRLLAPEETTVEGRLESRSILSPDPSERGRRNRGEAVGEGGA